MVRLAPKTVRLGALTYAAGASAGVPIRFTDNLMRASARPDRVMLCACSATLPATVPQT